MTAGPGHHGLHPELPYLHSVSHDFSHDLLPGVIEKLPCVAVWSTAPKAIVRATGASRGSVEGAGGNSGSFFNPGNASGELWMEGPRQSHVGSPEAHVTSIIFGFPVDELTDLVTG